MSVRKEQTSVASRMHASLVVLGMHHSGGSAIASGLELCGARLGERKQLRALCDALLHAAGTDHWKRVGTEGTCVIEDPRLCLLFPVLRHHVPHPVCIHVVRNPLDVARVLRMDSGLGIAEGLALWEAYNTSALCATEGLARVFVTYEELLAHPRECFGKLLRQLEALGVQGLERPPESAALDALFPSGSQGAGKAVNGTEGVLTSSQSVLWQKLSLGKLDAENDRRKAECEALERALQARAAQVVELKSKAKERASEINILNQRVAWLDAQVMELQASSSWRITMPFRALSTAIRKARTALGRRPGNTQGLSGREQADAAKARARPLAALGGEDTFVLYRVIGNDLYPRHKRGQAVENLQFILEHEPVLEGCEKRFILNRILSADVERDIIGLLERAGFEYVRIPFDAAEYARIGFDTDILPEPGFLAGEGFEALDDAGKGRLLAALYRSKNNYVMNNNGARNAALQDGRGRAKWILPWDGNCFLTGDAWKRIRLDIAKAPENRYFIVPMARMPSNDPLIDGGDIPKAVEEPQIIFRADAEERFNPAFCYGRRPKVELLWRLGVEGAWNDYLDDPWDLERSPVSPESAATGKAGWVARLSSGMTTLEANSDQAPLHRGLARSGAIQATLQHLDARLAGMDSEHPVSIRERVLRAEVENQGAPLLKDVVGGLLRTADEAIGRGLGPAAGGNETRLQSAFDDSMVLALASTFTGSRRYAEHGSAILESLFIDPGTRVDPYPGRGGNAGPISMKDMYYYLDAVRMFEAAGSVGESTKSALETWLETWLEWLSTSTEGVAERGAGDHRGTCHDLQVASIASFLDDQEMVYGSLMRAQARIGEQFAPDGSQPGELMGPATAHRCCFNFQSWVNLAELSSRWGVDLWGYRAPGGSSLGQGARWLLSRMGEPWPGGQGGGFDIERLQPIRFAARESIDDLPGGGRDELSPYAVKPVFSVGDGVRPFWNLGSYGRCRDGATPDE